MLVSPRSNLRFEGHAKRTQRAVMFETLYTGLAGGNGSDEREHVDGLGFQ